jgi:hypothetical protein
MYRSSSYLLPLFVPSGLIFMLKEENVEQTSTECASYSNRTIGHGNIEETQAYCFDTATVDDQV